MIIINWECAGIASSLSLSLPLSFGSLKPHKIIANFWFLFGIIRAGSIIALSRSMILFPCLLGQSFGRFIVIMSICAFAPKNLLSLSAIRVLHQVPCVASLCLSVCVWNDNECVVIFSMLCACLCLFLVVHLAVVKHTFKLN